ncbi:MAG: MarR family winged helix-turn-helix transcriptional regulator [Stellaceae bacterium]
MDDPQRDLNRFKLIDAPGHLLRRNHQRSYEIFARLVGDDVTRQQIALLIALQQNPGASQNQLVAATGFDKSTLKEMLGRMVTSGWVARARDPEDGRAWTMRITTAGRALLEERFPSVAQAQTEILAPLPAELRPVFIRCLRILLGLEPAAEQKRTHLPRHAAPDLDGA